MMIDDILGLASWRQVCVVFRTLPQAIHFWPKIVAAFEDRHGKDYIVRTKTAIVSHRTKTITRLWVPYSGEPTMPLDEEHHRRGFVLINWR